MRDKAGLTIVIVFGVITFLFCGTAINTLAKQNEIMRSALKVYADRGNWYMLYRGRDAISHEFMGFRIYRNDSHGGMIDGWEIADHGLRGEMVEMSQSDTLRGRGK